MIRSPVQMVVSISRVKMIVRLAKIVKDYQVLPMMLKEIAEYHRKY